MSLLVSSFFSLLEVIVSTSVNHSSIIRLVLVVDQHQRHNDHAQQCDAQHGNIEVCSQQEAQQEIRSDFGADEDLAQHSKAQCRQNAGSHRNAADDECGDDGQEALARRRCRSRSRWR